MCEGCLEKNPAVNVSYFSYYVAGYFPSYVHIQIFTVHVLHSINVLKLFVKSKLASQFPHFLEGIGHLS